MRQGLDLALHRIIRKPAAACRRLHETSLFAKNGVAVVKRRTVLAVHANIITVIALMMHTRLRLKNF